MSQSRRAAACFALLASVLAAAPVETALAQHWVDDALAELAAKVEAQAAEIRQLQARLDESGSPAPPPSNVRRLPEIAEAASSDKLAPDGSSDPYYTDYDDGFLIRPRDELKRPFELQVNGWIQFRHHAFDRAVTSWTDNAGVTRPIRNRNIWDIERARIVFSGHAVDRRLTYFLQLDGDTDGRHAVDFFDYWWAWKFGERFRVQVGKRKVPASRQWLLSARHTRFVDRPMANDFFRPDRTIGVFGAGRMGDHLHYQVMVGNGYRTTNLPNSESDGLFSYAASGRWEPCGAFGRQLADYGWSCRPLLQLGQSFVFSPQRGTAPAKPLGEADFLRLTDGTRLADTGALVPGVTVNRADLYFYGVDGALKWRGWSLNAELFLRWIQDLRGDGPLPLGKLFQRGYYVEGGRFLVAKRLDVNFRYSQVSGLFGNASEYALGCNWYPLDTPRLKLSFDATRLDGSPLNNNASDILVGDEGTLFRSQFQAEY